MARARNIKPAFFKNEVLAEMSAETRLLFIGLWTLSDREGRLEDRPKRIRAELFPLEMIDVEPMLSRLCDDGFLVRYEVDSTKYIQIENFVKHQDPHYKEKASEIPAPFGRSDIIKATSITRSQRAKILERDDYTCQGCGAKDHRCIDHVIPASRGGTSDDDNLQVLCMSCNTKKGNKLSGEQKGLKKSKHSTSAVITRSNIDPKLIQGNDPSPSDSLIPDSLSSDSLIPDSLHCAEPSSSVVVKLDKAKPKPKPDDTDHKSACRDTWNAYAQAYFDKYGTEPVRNAKVNGQVSQLVTRLGQAEAPAVAAHYLTSRDRYHVQNLHDFGLLLSKAEAIRTQWATGLRMTATTAQQIENTQTNLSTAEQAKAMLRNRGA